MMNNIQRAPGSVHKTWKQTGAYCGSIDVNTRNKTNCSERKTWTEYFILWMVNEIYVFEINEINLDQMILNEI